MKTRQTWARRLLSPLIRKGRGVARDESGAVLIEFAILSIPFFTLIFAIIETSMAFFAQQVLESALQDATRKILTGQSQTTWNASEFRKAVCGGTFGLFDCSADNAGTERLLIKVEPVTTFNSAVALIGLPVSADCMKATATEDDCKWDLTEAYDDGKGSDVIIAQAFYKWPTLINLPWFSLATQAGGNRLLSAVRVFKNEPFGT
ncbi:MAG: pilus assembly protein [Alphaproteobacteria bacterium]|nr:pilus assembly protein [Alphaproteobacteria bacterium]